MFAVSPAGYHRMLTVCTTSMQHIAIARAIKSCISTVTCLARSVGCLSWRTIDYNDIHELIYYVTKHSAGTTR